MQSGLRFCRCPACGADDRDEPLAWSLDQPKTLKCRRCGVIVPNDKYPAKAGGKEVPEETVEVLPGVLHHYPYHVVEDGKTRFPDERLYLQARIDYEGGSTWRRRRSMPRPKRGPGRRRRVIPGWRFWPA